MVRLRVLVSFLRSSRTVILVNILMLWLEILAPVDVRLVTRLASISGLLIGMSLGRRLVKGRCGAACRRELKLWVTVWRLLLMRLLKFVMIFLRGSGQLRLAWVTR